MVYVVSKQEQVEAARYSGRQNMIHRGRNCHPLWSAPRTCCVCSNYSDYGQRFAEDLAAGEFEELLQMQPADVGENMHNLRLRGVSVARTKDRISTPLSSCFMQDFWNRSASSQVNYCLRKVVRTSMSWE
jgi:hypothetical protein